MNSYHCRACKNILYLISSSPIYAVIGKYQVQIQHRLAKRAQHHVQRTRLNAAVKRALGDPIRFPPNQPCPSARRAANSCRWGSYGQSLFFVFVHERGAKVFCRIRGYLSTAQKNGVGALDALTRALRKDPFIPAFLPASIQIG